MRRREFLTALPLGLVAFAAGRSVWAGEQPLLGTSPSAFPEPGAPYWLLAPLRAGDEVGLGWKLSSLTPVRHGAAVLTLARGQEQARVHLCARRGFTHGIASTRHFDLLLMNDGDGLSRTDESLGRVIKTLAAYVERSERAHPERIAALGGVLPHHVRVALYSESEQLA